MAYHLQNVSFLSRHILTIRPEIASRKLTVRVGKPYGLISTPLLICTGHYVTAYLPAL